MANAPLQHPQPAWVLKIEHPDGVLWAASSDLTKPVDEALIGVPVFKRITNPQQIRVVEQMGDWSGGIVSPTTATVQLDNADGFINLGAEWRNVPATLYHYERSEAQLRTTIDGVIVDPPNSILGQVTLTIASHDPSIWSTLLPARVINPEEFPSATDMGAPVPVVFGTAYLSLPYCGFDEEPTSDPGGYDYLIGVQQDDDATPWYTCLEALYYDLDGVGSDLEAVNGWMPLPGSATFASGITFTATGDQSQWYVLGAIVRCVTAAAGVAGQWRYGVVTSYSGGVVTLRDITLDGAFTTGGFITAIDSTPTAGGTGYAVGDVLSLAGSGAVVVAAVTAGVVTRLKLKWPGYGNTVGTGKATTTTGAGIGCTVNILSVTGPEIATDALVENSRYYSGGTGAQHALLSIRIPMPTSSGVVARVRGTLSNPADVIGAILSNAIWGLGEPINADSFAAAKARYTAVGLGTCINAALGGDKQQRQAGQVMRELLALYGGRLIKKRNPVSNIAEWYLTVDQAPAAVSVTFGVDDGVYNNVKRVETNARRSLSEAVKTLQLRFGPTGRLKKSTDYGSAYLPGNYTFQIVAQCLSVGSTQTIVSPWLRYSADAQRVLAYAAKGIAAGDHQPVIVVGQEGRSVQIGDLVRYLSTVDGITGAATTTDFRVWRIERQLADIRLSLMGYNGNQFIYSASDTTTVNDVLDIDDTARATGHGGNLIINSDFSAGVKSATLAPDMVPGMRIYGRDGLTIEGHGADITSVAITADPSYIGGHALTIVTAVPFSLKGPVLRFGLVNNDWSGTSIIEGNLYVVSVYSSNTNIFCAAKFWGAGMGGDATAWQPVVRGMAAVTGQFSGAGWQRYYTVFRAPKAAPANPPFQYGIFCIGMLIAGTYQFDALQVEEAGTTGKSTDWRRNTKWGIDPALVQPGPLTIRLPGEAEHGTQLGHTTGVWALNSGASAETTVIPAGTMVQAVTTLQTNLTGPTTIDIGFPSVAGAYGDETAWGAAIPVATGTKTGAADFLVVNPPTFKVATPVLITAHGGNFTGGYLTVTVHWMRFVAPTG